MRDYYSKTDPYFERKNRSDLYKGYERLVKKLARRRARHLGAKWAIQEGLSAVSAGSD